MKVSQFSLQGKFLFVIIMITLPVLGLVFTWLEIQTIRQAREQALDKARIISRQVILTRQWVTDNGGAVLVPDDGKKPEAALGFHDKLVETELGRFRSFSPALVTKSLSQYSSREELYSFRLSSLNPMNPDNAPDAFEHSALERFTREKIFEVYQFNHDTLEYMVPLFMDKGCRRCHQDRAPEGEGMMGGLSVQISLKQMQADLKESGILFALSGVCLTLVTILTLFFLMRRMVIKPLKELEEKTLQVSRGHLESRVDIRTGDELERLGTAFNTMAEKLDQGRDLLEKRIEQATADLARANEELKALDSMKSDFLASMSHELRSPLTVIRGGINYLNRTLIKAENRSYIDIIEKNVTRLSRLVSDLFDFTKLEHGTIDWEFETESLTVLVEEVIEIVSPLLTEKKLQMACEHPGDLFADINLERIEQVLVNLMDNAIKFSRPATLIQVKLKQEDGWIVISVTDQGRGVPQDRLESIFDKFSTVPSGRDSKLEGTGLGLAISKAIIQAHGGRIWAESIEGVSSSFYFALPETRKASPDLDN